ncbi:sugar diacid utilization regulator [Paenibacillus sp. BIHB 4019]|uniref:Sugar diacid utilization regulator n=2 Tax=Paenibacillus sp. BIHB 4019 TaxID=1870819 RepID=A0A1B2DSA2_9BACL|nr:sugar diacid utilization regulator [Paenibacillus sp. BIHB 4019]
MMQDIPYNINIMNEHGIIIGSGQKERIGTIHQGAVQALTTRKRIEVWQDSALAKMGTNEPIMIHNQYVAVVGISGHPDEVRPFSNIVSTTVSLLIEQRNQLESLAHEASRKQAFLERLLSHTGSYSQKIKKEAAPYKLDLQLPTVLLYIKSIQLNAVTNKMLLQLPSFSIQDDEDAHIVFIQNESELDAIVQRFRQEQPQASIAISRREASIAACYEQARSAMNILAALGSASRLIRYEDVRFLVRFSHADLTRHPNLVGKLEDTADLVDTLRSFIRHSGSMTATADELSIHRNTLQYRLKRIQTLTGKNPRDLLELIELTHGLLTFYQ